MPEATVIYEIDYVPHKGALTKGLYERVIVPLALEIDGIRVRPDGLSVSETQDPDVGIVAFPVKLIKR